MRTKGTKNKGRKGLSLLLVMCMVLSLLPVTAMAAEGNCTGDHTGWRKLSGNVSSLDGGKKYVLTGDVEVQTNIFIDSEVTLCLSGHTMNLNGHNIIINGDAGPEASLALHDCAGRGSITGGDGGKPRSGAQPPKTLPARGGGFWWRAPPKTCWVEPTKKTNPTR